MTRSLLWFATIAVVVTLVTTFVAILGRWSSAAQLLELTQALLSWKVIAGGLVLGAGAEFTGLLSRLPK